MEGSAGAPPQRVCPNCARISWATGPRCPYCRARFRRAQGVTPWMLALTALVVLAGVLGMFLIAANRFDDRVDRVNQRVDEAVNQLRSDVRKELDARVPTNSGGIVPTPTPTPFPTPTPTVEGESTPTPSPSPAATSSPEASVTSTASPDEERTRP
ncbi:MAG TPA: hypothetical protein VFG79_17280 [Solirubrobacter sp.]|nr:hypothetical protein [Solirubrobacter sp.]